MGRLELNQKPMYYLNSNNNISADLFMKANTFAFAASYAGMTLKQIADWYPKPITVDAIIDYLIQEHEFDIIENIFAYMDNPILANDDIAAKLGLLDFCTYADWLSHRVCFMMYAGTDTWMLLNNEDKKTRYQRINNTSYKISDYLEYITELEGGDKRYITKNEFELFLKDSKNNKKHESLYDMDYSVDSLFFALFQHGEDYGYDFDKIVDEVLVKDEQSGANLSIANDFIKYYDFLEDNCQGKSNILTKENVIYNFFEKASIEHFQELERKQKEAELEKIKAAVKAQQKENSNKNLNNDDVIITDLEQPSPKQSNSNNLVQSSSNQSSLNQSFSKQQLSNSERSNSKLINKNNLNQENFNKDIDNTNNVKLKYAYKKDIGLENGKTSYAYRTDINLNYIKQKRNAKNNKKKNIKTNHDNLNSSEQNNAELNTLGQNTLNQTDANLNNNSNITKEMRNKFKNKHLRHFKNSKNKIKSIY